LVLPPGTLSAQRFFQPRLFFSPEIFSAQNSFSPEIFPAQTFFQPRDFFSPEFFQPMFCLFPEASKVADFLRGNPLYYFSEWLRCISPLHMKSFPFKIKNMSEKYRI
jgi:hypothetical protein